MKVKCYAIYEARKEIIAEYTNVSQKTFLAYELATVAQRFAGSQKINQERSSNGVWYGKASEKTGRTHLVLLSTQFASLTTAASLISVGIQLDSNNSGKEKLGMRLGEQIKTLNANSKMQTLNSNVMELQNIMKGNVNKIINNMGDLQVAEKKSQRLHEMSMHFESDARKLQQKLKKKACMRKIIFAGVIALVLVFLFYFFIM